jgi:hypothetical protein
MHDFYHALSWHIRTMFFGHVFYFQHLEQGLETFIISHMPPMGENVIDYNKLHIFPFRIKRDINLELVQDGRVGINNAYTFIFHMHWNLVEMVWVNINTWLGHQTFSTSNMFQIFNLELKDQWHLNLNKSW